jgi:hypothetical protein
MQSLTAPATPTSPGPRAARGRWIWSISGVLTITAIGAFASWAVVRGERVPSPAELMNAVPTRIISVTAAVTALSVQSYGAPIKVTTVPSGPVKIAESISYAADRDGPPLVTDTDSHGLLTLAAPACANSDCSVAFAVTVPSRVTVSAVAEGGAVTVVGTGSATIDSGGGPVYAAGISGPLTVNAEGGGVTVAGAGATKIDSGGGPVTATTIRGPLGVNAEGGGVQLDGVTGTLSADTGGGPLSATSITSSSATVLGEGGDVSLGFTAAPVSVRVSTGGGGASLLVPGGPYSVTAEGGGSTESVLIANSPGATRSISVSTDGGNLQIGPA